MIQAAITRDSWPAGESAWNYVTTLKQIEKMDDSTFRVSAVLCEDKMTDWFYVPVWVFPIRGSSLF